MDKRLYNLTVTIGLTTATFYFANWNFNRSTDVVYLLFIILIRVVVGAVVFQTHTFAWSRAGSKSGILSVLSGLVAGAIYTLVLNVILFKVGLRFLLTEWVFFHFALLMSLYSYRYFKLRSIRGSKKVIIYGSGTAADRVTSDLENSGYKILFYMDDSKSKQNRRIEGKRVLSFARGLSFIRAGHTADLCVIAITDMSKDRLKTRYSKLAPHFKDIRILPKQMELVESKSFFAQTRPLTVENLLARTPKDLDPNAIKNFLEGKIVLVTGAGGSIGSEIVRQCVKYNAAKVVMVDHSEFNLYSMVEELNESDICHPVMVSVRDLATMDQVFQENKPQIVIHAAAYKHVPLCEQNIQAAVKNNVVGTKNLVDLSIKYDAEEMVLISTDKAVRPTNVMGTTKRICELYAQNSNGRGKTKIVAVRFGNVLGSSGSVVPKFNQLIAEGKNLTVTDPNITRYFMLIPEACSLVLQAGALGNGGEIFILDMGEPVLIADLAQRMIDYSGRDDLKVVFTGLRPGEKLYEELLINDADRQTKYESILVAEPTQYDYHQLEEDINKLLDSRDKLSVLKEIVPEFKHNPG
jgi:FlaA1/EpsC-like NDP-sugar epimerase